MSKPYLPGADARFGPWLVNFAAYLAANRVALGLTQAQVDRIAEVRDGFADAYAGHTAAIQTARAARAAKAAARRDGEDEVRAIVRILQANPAVTDTQRAALGVTVPKGNKSPVPAPASRPDPDVRLIEELSHTLRIVDSQTHRAARPDGCGAAEVWLKLLPAGAPAPQGPDGFEFAGLATASRFTRDFDGADAGKTAYYRCRYVNEKGQPGPWGSQAAATVAA